ncbi:beta-ketoacyl-ACP synthase II [Candidatus Lucifugimonas marina]|jgi:3-oxoacyl-[acyl-carrier-protein] synthase II|uniref:3-oxoacyl-[acyl-carrier-protein] synthase 2 n=1 Tax=Candidatus Lucifugimonas marina TaxID=3038979 RepID=A0AAJ5ZLF1_9CHLR|nr:beta-ketoacyl-ACP synthase II [SAR202 cluster bacterium JH702]MDG0870832.1 beta-ketoacyl-ACP synthase II [SAR202 cluster bacterium JH639]WFG36450.1 beta-ketoacyl-ACP synthase II [SAR202 cluster bacterium JH545]WFG40383.1 beta-ketoacyl-ACP synthase II [SAR202 cluster bacterium JH1073]
MTTNNETRVVVTGMGAITCLGNSVDEFWTGIKSGQSGIREISLVSPGGFPCSVSGEIQDFNPADYMDRKEARRMARFSQFAVVAAHQAVADSGINFDDEDLDRIGVLVGTGSGGLPETDQQAEIRVKRGVGRMSPYYIPMMLVNMASANISHTFNLTGYTNTCVTACAAGTQSIGEAAEVIRRGAADVIVTGGTEAGICEIGMGGFSTMRALSTWDGDPSLASRPFDKGRDGFAPAEGSGILILESLEHAQARGAKIYAEIAGWGVSSDAYHLVQPHPEGSGAAKAMNRALTNAGVTINDIDYINAHGTSTPINDASETRAIKAVFGDQAYNVPISSTKSMVGHSLGASGSLEAIACINSINDSVLHPTINQEESDPDCDLDYIPNVARETEVNVALSNSFGFGGQNACLVIKKFA